ncbi:ABC-2 family transporter protein [Clostridium amylolyticum]|uniref:ABC-2 family transporter protein n=1 Tax=Clostridium amylolyticum TaxID=1121298 RepID=A0A1M6NZB2_9CLOT|nr:ABC-2 transporter permease [Clostridium amylolyticum]SHK00972.1 ABC-2 family transporter protein [Clostridium amylolyticum]
MIGAIKMTKLDIFTMRQQLSMYLILVLMGMIFSFMNSSIFILCFTCSWFVALMASTVFSIEEKNNLKRLYGTLSVRIKDIVLGRYIFVILNYILAIFAIIVLSSAIALFKSKTINVQDVLMGFSVSFLIFSVMVGIQMPLFFKGGYTKAKFWLLVPYVAIMALVIIQSFVGTLSGVINLVMSNKNIFIIIGFIVSCIVLIISYNMSLLLYQKTR